MFLSIEAPFTEKQNKILEGFLKKKDFLVADFELLFNEFNLKNLDRNDLKKLSKIFVTMDYKKFINSFHYVYNLPDNIRKEKMKNFSFIFFNLNYCFINVQFFENLNFLSGEIDQISSLSLREIKNKVREKLKSDPFARSSFFEKNRENILLELKNLKIIENVEELEDLPYEDIVKKFNKQDIPEIISSFIFKSIDEFFLYKIKLLQEKFSSDFMDELFFHYLNSCGYAIFDEDIKNKLLNLGVSEENISELINCNLDEIKNKLQELGINDKRISEVTDALILSKVKDIQRMFLGEKSMQFILDNFVRDDEEKLKKISLMLFDLNYPATFYSKNRKFKTNLTEEEAIELSYKNFNEIVFYLSDTKKLDVPMRMGFINYLISMKFSYIKKTLPKDKLQNLDFLCDDFVFQSNKDAFDRFFYVFNNIENERQFLEKLKTKGINLFDKFLKNIQFFEKIDIKKSFKIFHSILDYCQTEENDIIEKIKNLDADLKSKLMDQFYLHYVLKEDGVSKISKFKEVFAKIKNKKVFSEAFSKLNDQEAILNDFINNGEENEEMFCVIFDLSFSENPLDKLAKIRSKNEKLGDTLLIHLVLNEDHIYKKFEFKDFFSKVFKLPKNLNLQDLTNKLDVLLANFEKTTHKKEIPNLKKVAYEFYSGKRVKDSSFEGYFYFSYKDFNKFYQSSFDNNDEILDVCITWNFMNEKTFKLKSVKQIQKIEKTLVMFGKFPKYEELVKNALSDIKIIKVLSQSGLFCFHDQMKDDNLKKLSNLLSGFSMAGSEGIENYIKNLNQKTESDKSIINQILNEIYESIKSVGINENNISAFELMIISNKLSEQTINDVLYFRAREKFLSSKRSYLQLDDLMQTRINEIYESKLGINYSKTIGSKNINKDRYIIVNNSARQSLGTEKKMSLENFKELCIDEKTSINERFKIYESLEEIFPSLKQEIETEINRILSINDVTVQKKLRENFIDFLIKKECLHLISDDHWEKIGLNSDDTWQELSLKSNCKYKGSGDYRQSLISFCLRKFIQAKNIKDLEKIFDELSVFKNNIYNYLKKMAEKFKNHDNQKYEAFCKKLYVEEIKYGMSGHGSLNDLFDHNLLSIGVFDINELKKSNILLETLLKEKSLKAHDLYKDSLGNFIQKLLNLRILTFDELKNIFRQYETPPEFLEMYLPNFPSSFQFFSSQENCQNWMDNTLSINDVVEKTINKFYKEFCDFFQKREKLYNSFIKYCIIEEKTEDEFFEYLEKYLKIIDNSGEQALEMYYVINDEIKKKYPKLPKILENYLSSLTESSEEFKVLKQIKDSFENGEFISFDDFKENSVVKFLENLKNDLDHLLTIERGIFGGTESLETYKFRVELIKEKNKRTLMNHNGIHYYINYTKRLRSLFVSDDYLDKKAQFFEKYVLIKKLNRAKYLEDVKFIIQCEFQNDCNSIQNFDDLKNMIHNEIESSTSSFQKLKYILIKERVEELILDEDLKNISDWDVSTDEKIREGFEKIFKKINRYCDFESYYYNNLQGFIERLKNENEQYNHQFPFLQMINRIYTEKERKKGILFGRTCLFERYDIINYAYEKRNLNFWQINFFEKLALYRNNYLKNNSTDLFLEQSFSKFLELVLSRYKEIMNEIYNSIEGTYLYSSGPDDIKPQFLNNRAESFKNFSDDERELLFRFIVNNPYIYKNNPKLKKGYFKGEMMNIFDFNPILPIKKTNEVIAPPQNLVTLQASRSAVSVPVASQIAQAVAQNYSIQLTADSASLKNPVSQRTNVAQNPANQEGGSQVLDTSIPGNQGSTGVSQVSTLQNYSIQLTADSASLRNPVSQRTNVWQNPANQEGVSQVLDTSIPGNHQPAVDSASNVAQNISQSVSENSWLDPQTSGNQSTEQASSELSEVSEAKNAAITSAAESNSSEFLLRFGYIHSKNIGGNFKAKIILSSDVFKKNLSLMVGASKKLFSDFELGFYFGAEGNFQSKSNMMISCVATFKFVIVGFSISEKNKSLFCGIIFKKTFGEIFAAAGRNIK